MHKSLLTFGFMLGLSISSGSVYATTSQINEKEILKIADQSAEALTSVLTNLCIGISDMASCKSVYADAEEKMVLLKKHSSPAVELRINRFSILASTARDAEKRYQAAKISTSKVIHILYKNGKCQNYDDQGELIPMQSNGIIEIPAGSTIDLNCLKNN